jgi:integrase
VQELEKQTLGERKRSQSSVANTLKPLGGTFGYAVFKGLIAVNPMTQIPRGYRPSCATQREHREWTTAEVDLVIEKAKTLKVGDEATRRCYALAIEVLLRTGLRLGECLGLRFGDIDFTGSVLAIGNSWSKAGELGPVKTAASNRRVPVTAALLQQLAARSLELEGDDETFVFALKKGDNPPYQSTIRRRAWLPAIKAANLTDGPKVTPHDARHAFASQLADLDLTSGDLAPILGHTTAGITEGIYLHSFNRDEREKRVREAMERAAS